MSSRESTANVVHVHPTRRRSSKDRIPPEMSDLRIVLLGRSVSENSRVGNFILGRAAFDSESPSDDEEPYSVRIRRKHMTVINMPLLLNPDLSLRHMTQGVKECVSLSAPGPHVIVLVLKPDECSREEKVCVETVLRCFSDSVFEHTLVLTTQEPDSAEPTEVSDVIKEIIHKCLNRHYRLGRNSTSADLRATFEDIVQGNDGHYLTCDKYEDSYFTIERAQVETCQEKTNRPCQSSVNNDENTFRENTSSKTMGKDHSDGKSLRVAHHIKNNWSRKIADGNNENLPKFKLKLSETWRNRDGFCRRSTFGTENVTKMNKTIMMIGATGSGKSTLINSMINYILGVEWEDDFRFVLIDEGKQKSQAESQTSVITAYQINHMDDFRVPYSLTIVDTPGFGDTRGISHDQKITKQIQEFFSNPGGIDHIDAMCFVVQASFSHLMDTQKLIFDFILSMIGKDIAENILVLVTFADGKTPPVLEAIKVSGVPCSTNESGEPLHFKFNNSAVFANSKSAEDEDSNCGNFDQMFWKLGFSSMKKFFTSLNMMETKSLTLTREVLKERQQLEVLVEGLHPQINAGLTKLDEIRKTRAALQQHKAEMDANKDFEYEVEVTVPKQIKNNTGYYLMNCQKCHFTCHDRCPYARDSDKYKCVAMKDGKCTVCPGKCPWNVHFNQKYRWVYVTEKRKETYRDLKKRYEDTHGQVMSKEKIFEELEKELEKVQDSVTRLIKKSQNSLERLQEIALKPNPLSTPDYIDLMIESEKQEAKPGFMDRIESLMEVRKKAEIISKVSTGEVLPEDWKQYKPETRKKAFYDPKAWFSWPSNH